MLLVYFINVYQFISTENETTNNKYCIFLTQVRWTADLLVGQNKAKYVVFLKQ